VGGRIEVVKVPVSPAARAVLAAGGTTLGELLTGGEDYEVLATVPVARADDFERLAQRAGVRVTCIGSITGSMDDGVHAFEESGKTMVFTKTGWDHFHSRDVS
jgi:thiamine-monophosphate kinase